MVEDWAKIKHNKTGHEFHPSKLQDYITSQTFLNSDKKEKLEPVQDPTSLSRFLKFHKNSETKLYCILTKKSIRNNWKEADMHVEGS